MKESADEHTEANTPNMTAPGWRGYWVAALVAGLAALAGLCAALYFIVLPSTVVTPNPEPIARQALANPASAKLHLHEYYEWKSYSPGDYAVEDGMVIFPNTGSGSSLFSLDIMNEDKRIPVLVYAADGRDLTTSPVPPTDRSWYYFGEWYLYNCRADPFHSLWWECSLLIGGHM